MKKSKPEDYDTMYSFTSGNIHDLFISVGIYEFCLHHCYNELMGLKFGINVFVFDIDSCEFFEEGK